MKPRVLLAAASLFVFFASATAQARRSAFADSASLRRSFLAAFGSDLELVKDEVHTRSNESGGGSYWLALPTREYEGNTLETWIVPFGIPLPDPFAEESQPTDDLEPTVKNPPTAPIKPLFD